MAFLHKKKSQSDKKEPKNPFLKPGLKDRLLKRFDWLNKFRHWWLGGASITRSIFRVAAAWQTLLVLVVLLSCGYVVAAFYTNSGEFVISIDRKMGDAGFLLSDTTDFSEKLLTLHGTPVIDADNINIMDIDRNVMWVDGSHNGVNYVAYTFYLKNDTGETHNYGYQFIIRHTTKGVDKASWMMVYRTPNVTGVQDETDGNGTDAGRNTGAESNTDTENTVSGTAEALDLQPILNIYAALNADGLPERQYSLFDFPFVEYNGANASQAMQLSEENTGNVTTDVMDYLQIADISQIRQLTAEPFEASDMVCSGIQEDMLDQQIDKYTVVIWLEGEDPECIDNIRGGELECAFQFTY